MTKTTCITAMLFLAVPASAQTTPADVDFEAALGRVQKAAPRPVTAPSRTGPPPRPAKANGRPFADRPALAPAGTVPGEWQHLPRDPTQLDNAEKTTWAGTLDPYSFIAQQGRTIPAIPGGTPLRCGNHGLQASFTTGDVAFPDMRKAMSVAIHGDPADPLAELKATNVHLNADKFPATKAKMAEIDRVLKAHGYVRLFGGIYRRLDSRGGQLSADTQVLASPYVMAPESARLGVTVPTGPCDMVTLTFPFDDWKDSIPPTPGR